jgi:hypothetical protein
MTATAPPASGAVPTWPTTRPHAGRSAGRSRDAGDRCGWLRCRSPCQRGPRRAGCGADQRACAPAARHPGPPRTWWCRRRWRRSPPRQAAARSRRRPGGACSQACHDRPGLRPRGPPRLARMLMVSTLARDQSSRPCSPSRSNTSRWSWSNTPACAHSARRRQQVAGEPQPSSRAGNSRHGVEVRAMYTIAAKQLRSEMARRRPPYGGRGGAGSKGATSAHSSSGTRSSTSVVMARDHARSAQGSETTSKHQPGTPDRLRPGLRAEAG